MKQRIALALLMGLTWMPLTASVSPGGYLVGVVLSFALLTLIFPNSDASNIVLTRLPQQLLSGTVYTLILFRDIYLSAIDVAKRVTNPAMPLNPGIIAVSTQFHPAESDRDGQSIADTVAAISAHGITITPGELVVDFEGNQIMYVHCLDVTASTAVAESNQAKRLAFLRRIFSE